jgi:hypothetical protein
MLKPPISVGGFGRGPSETLLLQARRRNRQWGSGQLAITQGATNDRVVGSSALIHQAPGKLRRTVSPSPCRRMSQSSALFSSPVAIRVAGQVFNGFEDTIRIMMAFMALKFLTISSRRHASARAPLRYLVL